MTRLRGSVTSASVTGSDTTSRYDDDEEVQSLSMQYTALIVLVH